MSKTAFFRSRIIPIQIVSFALLGLAACGKQAPAFEEIATPEAAIPGTDIPHQITQDPNEQIASLEKEFSATDTADGHLALSWGDDEVVQDITIAGETGMDTVTYQQKMRAQKTELFAQGSLDSTGSESFVQNPNGGVMGVLDILVVVDNSGSMTEEQVNLSTKLAPLLQEVKQSDWKIGVVTTDPNDGCLRSLISKNDPNPEEAFAKAVTAGVKGSGNERGVYQAVSALKGLCTGGSWLRPNSTLAVLIVSDEDNCSDGKGCSGDEANGNDLINYLAGIREVGVNARIYGLIWHSSLPHSSCSAAANRADIYSNLIARSQGDWGSICANDYTNTLAKISTNISVILKSQFALKYAPLAGQLEVLVNGKRMNSGYHVVGNVVEFASAPALGSTIQFNYKYRTKDPQSTFALQGQATQNSLVISLDGTIADANAYQYNTTKRTITFQSAPVASEIKVSYLDESTLMDSFPLPADLDPASLKVRVNQKLISSDQYQFDASKQIIRFASSPTEGAAIQITFNRGNISQYKYPLLFDNVRSVTNAQGKTIAYTITEKTLAVSAADLAQNDHIFVHYQQEMNDKGIMPLSYPLVADSLEVDSATSGRCSVEKITMTNEAIDFSGCGFEAGEKISINFQYVIDQKTTFTIVEDPFTDMTIPWVVTVNDQETTEFSRDAGTLSFDELPYGAHVVVKVMMPKLH